MFVLDALQVFANRAMQSRAALQREADNWLEGAGTLPPGGWAAVAQSGGAAVEFILGQRRAAACVRATTALLALHGSAGIPLHISPAIALQPRQWRGR